MKQPARLEELEEEGRLLSSTFPSLRLDLVPDGRGIVTGHVEVADGVAYTVEMLVPTDYPDYEPILIVDPVEIPWKIDRHVFEKSGRACLCARSETRVHWPRGSNLTEFVARLVVPFFIGQFYYDTHGNWPPTGERSHGRAGIIEAFVDLLPELANVDVRQIENVVRLLARKNDPKGHELCPCGNGKRLRKCHRQMIARLRACVDPRHAALDLKEAFGTRADSK